MVYEIPGEPGWVLKEYFYPGLQARNEYTNLEAARLIRPQNVVKAEPPTDPRQGWLVKERVYLSDTPPDPVQLREVLRDFRNVNDAMSNLRWGSTIDDPTPRWLLIE